VLVRVECSPARSFLTETCDEDPTWQVPTDGLYEAYQRWCKTNGYQPLGERAFGKEVKRVFPGSERVRRQVEGSRLYLYQGLRSPDLAYRGCRIPLHAERRPLNRPPSRSGQPSQDDPPVAPGANEGALMAHEDARA